MAQLSYFADIEAPGVMLIAAGRGARSLTCKSRNRYVASQSGNMMLAVSPPSWIFAIDAMAGRKVV
jgi:hypothetical protein